MAVGEWDQRELCPDGSCVGVIGPEGTCKVCGRAAANWGDERKRGLIDPEGGDDGEPDDADELDDVAALDHADGEDDEDEEDDDGEDDEDADGEDDRAAATEFAAAPPAPEWSGRRLCPDGACIGLIGLDGRCKVCGRTESRDAGDAGDPVQPAAVPPAGSASADPSMKPDATTSSPVASVGITEELATTPVVANGATGVAAASQAPAASVDPESTLVPCPDPGCAGVSDRDGHCNLCGKVVA